MMGTAHAVERVKPPRFLVRMANPVMRRALASPVHRALSRHLLLLHVTGRRSGRHYLIPVGHRRVDGRLTVLTTAAWRVNLRGGAAVEVTLGGRCRPAYASLIEDPQEVAAAYLGMIERYGWKAAQRRLGIRISVGRTPTMAELADLARRSRLSLIRLDLR